MAKRINWDDKEQVLKEVAKVGYALNAVSKRLRDDEDVVKVAIRGYPEAFSFASDRLKSDKRFVRYAISLAYENFKYASEDLRNDEDTIFYAVGKNPLAVQFASIEKRSDLDFVLRLFKQNQIINKTIYYITPYLSKEILDNKELGLLIVKSNGDYFSYLSDRLKDDLDVFTTALKSSKNAFQYGSERLKNLYADKLNEILIDMDGIKINIKSFMTEKDVEYFRTQLNTAIKYINQSPIHSFKKVLSSVFILVGTNNNIGKFGQTENQIASYHSSTKKIHYFFDKKDEKQPFITLIHELAHQYHHTIVKNGFNNQEIINLFKKATTSKKQCELFNLPQIGDPLSDLRENWWSVRMSSRNDFVLTKIIKGVYIYEDGTGKDVIYTLEEIIRMLACPSEYGSENEMEFFAEMTTLITLGLVKPNQQVIANKFMQILNIY